MTSRRIFHDHPEEARKQAINDLLDPNPYEVLGEAVLMTIIYGGGLLLTVCVFLVLTGRL